MGEVDQWVLSYSELGGSSGMLLNTTVIRGHNNIVFHNAKRKDFFLFVP